MRTRGEGNKEDEDKGVQQGRTRNNKDEGQGLGQQGWMRKRGEDEDKEQG